MSFIKELIKYYLIGLLLNRLFFFFYSVNPLCNSNKGIYCYGDFSYTQSVIDFKESGSCFDLENSYNNLSTHIIGNYRKKELFAIWLDIAIKRSSNCSISINSFFIKFDIDSFINQINNEIFISQEEKEILMIYYLATNDIYYIKRLNEKSLYF